MGISSGRRKNSSGDKLSFPSIEIHDREFEFEVGCITPGSPTSPADHLFLNGRLLPHAFPSQPNIMSSGHCSRSVSRTSSISKDSLTSSRSNSTNSSRSTSSSSSSSSSSARTSTSTNEGSPADRKVVLIAQPKVATREKKSCHPKHNKPILGTTPQYGSSKRWQFIVPAPVLGHQASSRRKKGEPVGAKHKRRENKRGGDDKIGFCRRFFRLFVSTCKECHAIKPSKRVSVLKRDVMVHE